MPRDAEELYDLYLDACLTGEVEDPQEFCARHPDLADTMRARIAALHDLMREQRVAEAAPLPLAAEDGLPYERLGDFRLLRRLEKGGMGMLFLAEQESLGRPVALKVVRPELQDSATAAERFRREALAVARLQHPNVVRVFAMGEDQGVRYIAMELVPGRTLDELLTEERPPTSRALRWALGLARALEHAHAEGVVHRDVKPANIRITPDDRPLLLDFGVARDDRWQGITLTRAFTGSPLYAAPEQLKGAAVDGRADVYALGVTLYQCLTGRVPFGGEQVEQVFHRVLTDEPVPPRRHDASIPRDVEIVTLKALAKDPADRYASAAAFAADLEAILEFRPIRAKPPGPWTRLRHWSRRRPGPAAALATLLVAVVVAGVWAVVQRKAEARDAVAKARARLALFRERRAAIAEAEREVTDLQRKMHAQYMTGEQEQLLEEKEDAVAHFRREREEMFYEVLDHLRRAERLDPDLSGIRSVYAELFAEKWREARIGGDRAAEQFYAERIAENDPELLRRLRPTVRISFQSVPAGADVYLFRYREQADVVEGGDHRLVPVPLGEPDLPVAPGTWALRIVRGAGGIEPGDLIVELDGEPIRGFRQTVPEGAAARVFRMGEVREAVLPAGLVVRTTAAPVLTVPAGRFGRTPTDPIELQRGDYLLVARLDGYDEIRRMLDLEHFEFDAMSFTFEPRGSTPPGWVRVGLSDPYWIMEREVTAGEYLEFLNDPATLRRVEESQESILVPRDREYGPYWKRRDGRYVLPEEEWEPDWPVIGVSWHDAKAYAAWRTARSDEYVFTLPTYEEWLTVGDGMGSRDYPFGNRFRPKWVKSCYAQPQANPEPVMRYPIDESPWGVYDMCGSAREWLDDWYDEGRGMRRLGGGAWGTARPERMKLYGAGLDPDHANGESGLRLVRRRR